MLTRLLNVLSVMLAIRTDFDISVLVVLSGSLNIEYTDLSDYYWGEHVAGILTLAAWSRQWSIVCLCMYRACLYMTCQVLYKHINYIQLEECWESPHKCLYQQLLRLVTPLSHQNWSATEQQT